jgi:hypothetical protein
MPGGLVGRGEKLSAQDVDLAVATIRTVAFSFRCDVALRRQDLSAGFDYRQADWRDRVSVALENDAAKWATERLVTAPCKQ